jgi:hypothetical protein
MKTKLIVSLPHKGDINLDVTEDEAFDNFICIEQEESSIHLLIETSNNRIVLYKDGTYEIC